MTAKRIVVLGGGAWGTALAITATRAGHDVSLWARDAATVDAINLRRENPRYLPGIGIDADFRATTNMTEACGDAECVLLSVPAQKLRAALEAAHHAIPTNATLVLCAKGIEVASGKFLSAVAAEILPANYIASLSGPSFATDVAKGLPTAVAVAAPDADRAAEIASDLSSLMFRCYSTDDLAGVEAGGALKNVLAIGAGAVAGAGLGASAHAALVTRGFVELRRIATAFGARPETLMGLSGLGDLVLTCGSTQSRNFAYGLAVGKGQQLDNLPLAEGVATCAIAARLIKERGIDAPITEAIDLLLRGEASVREAVTMLMTRPLRSEDK
ncbi:MAG TPA: NAD(P)H-dependent glycerol-3-phosphate dehydrogenase [Rhizobiaceae bacterium]|nr:NAD(P)H-dependent glycerol-3-phosphate dehydrogenase [Rhizobiaceae bacterium]